MTGTRADFFVHVCRCIVIMTRKHCCYGICKSDSRYYGRSYMEGIFFINFPKPITQPEKCERWIRYCGRPQKDFNVNKVNRNTFICSKHFVGGNGPTDQHPDPIPATATQEQAKKFCKPKRKAPSQRIATINPLPEKKKRVEAAEALLSLATATVQGPSSDEILTITTPHEDDSYPKLSAETQTSPKDTRDASSQTIYEKYILQAKIDSIMNTNSQKLGNSNKTADRPILCLDQFKDDDKKMKYFTGLHYFQFVSLFQFLGPCVNNLNYWGQNKRVRKTKSVHKKTTPTEELFITLIRLRRGFCFTTMRHLFQLSETTLRMIFTTWLQLLYCHFKDIQSHMFPDRHKLKKFLPQSFKSFKNVRCSVDCTEFFCEMPRNFRRQGNLFSSYKHHHTFKCLIAVAPNGTGVFISDLYEGAISDREIFEQCGILNYLNPGDLLLVDRGFTVEDILMPRQISMNIPPFLKGRDKLTPQEELLTRKIAKARIHVERYNERLKKFRLISGTMPLNMAHLAIQAVYVSACLVNFQDQLAE